VSIVPTVVKNDFKLVY